MKVYTETFHEEMIPGPDRVVLLLRRVGTTVGFLFGFGLLALLMASTASAEGSQRGDDGPPPAGQSLLGTVSSVLSPVTDTVTKPAARVLDPAAPLDAAGSDAVGPVGQPVARMVEPVTNSVVGPILRPVVESVVAPVLAPVVDTVTPVLDAVSPVTERLVGPLLHAVDPVIESVTGAIGVDDEVSTVTETVTGRHRDQQASTGPHVQSPPVVQSPSLTQPDRSRVDAASPATVPERTVEHAVRWDSGRVAEANVAAVSPVGFDQPGQLPGGPAGPAGVAPGGTGSLGGPGGPHNADAALSTPSGRSTNDDGSGRSPPGTMTWHSWLGYDQPDCPS